MAVENISRLPYFVASHPNALLAKLQRLGFFTGMKADMFRDAVVLSFGLMGLFFLAAKIIRGSDAEGWFIGILVVSSLLYMVVYVIVSGMLMQIIATIIMVALLTGASAVFPPLGILLALVLIVLFIKKVIAVLCLIPWIGLSFAFYYLLLNALGNDMVAQTYPFDEYWGWYAGFSLALGIWCAIRYPLGQSGFRFAIMFGVAPIIVMLLLMSDGDSDVDGWDISDGVPNFDYNGLRIDFPDGTHLRWVEGASVTPHWRFYA